MLKATFTKSMFQMAKVEHGSLAFQWVKNASLSSVTFTVDEFGLAVVKIRLRLLINVVFVFSANSQLVIEWWKKRACKKQFSPTRTCESWLPGEMSWRQEQSMNELRFMGTSAVTPVGLFALGGNGRSTLHTCTCIFFWLKDIQQLLL